MAETFLGGVLTSTFSCVLLAELAVGRIMRSKKPPSGAFVPATLMRGFDFGCSKGRDLGGKEVRAVLWRRCATGFGWEEVRSLLAAETLLARLGDREGGGTPSNFAAEAVVGAVADAGSLTGRVGDLGRGFVKPGGEVGPTLWVGFGCADLEVAASGTFAATEVPVDFWSGILLLGFGALSSLGGKGCLGVVVFDGDCSIGAEGLTGVRGAGADFGGSLLVLTVIEGLLVDESTFAGPLTVGPAEEVFGGGACVCPAAGTSAIGFGWNFA